MRMRVDGRVKMEVMVVKVIRRCWDCGVEMDVNL